MKKMVQELLWGLYTVVYYLVLFVVLVLVLAVLAAELKQAAQEHFDLFAGQVQAVIQL